MRSRKFKGALVIISGNIGQMCIKQTATFKKTRYRLTLKSKNMRIGNVNVSAIIVPNRIEKQDVDKR